MKNFLKGVTIIELIMIFLIIGIVISITLPRFEVFNYVKLEGAIKEVVADIRFVQTVAISTHEDYAIEFDPVADTYRAYRVADNTPLKDPFTGNDLEVNFAVDPQYKGVDITNVDVEGTDTLRFNWQGVPLDANGDDITRPARIGLGYLHNSRAIVISPSTGVLSVE